MIVQVDPLLGIFGMLLLGLIFVLLGIIPLLPGYKIVKKHDPTHWSSYVGCFILGIAVIVWAFMKYFAL